MRKVILGLLLILRSDSVAYADTANALHVFTGRTLCEVATYPIIVPSQVGIGSYFAPLVFGFKVESGLANLTFNVGLTAPNYTEYFSGKVVNGNDYKIFDTARGGTLMDVVDANVPISIKITNMSAADPDCFLQWHLLGLFWGTL